MTARIYDFNERFSLYLRDESRHAGYFKTIVFPETMDELIEVIQGLYRKSEPFTVQGARTGISGAAVPHGGHVISTEKLTGLSPVYGDPSTGFCIEAECGATLDSILAAASAKNLVFRPNPTEKTATIGGLFATGSSGCNSYRWGKTADHVLSAEIITPEGDLLEIRRGEHFFDEHGCILPNGTRIYINKYPKLSGVCSFTPFIGMDLLDLFAGSEGMLGIVARVKLALSPKQCEPWGIVFFFSGHDTAASFVKAVTEMDKESGHKQSRVSFLEFFDKNTLSLIRLHRENVSSLKKIPDIPSRHSCAVYLELEEMNEEDVEGKLAGLLELFENLGGQESDTWAAAGSTEVEKFRLFRHAAPEAVNARVDYFRKSYPAAYKMCIDISAPVEKLSEYVNMYEHDITESGIEGFVFGHAAENRLHINIIPRNDDERIKGAILFSRWGKKAVGDGGKILSENGIGKTKKVFFLENVSADELELLKHIKKFFDPKGLLNPENMF